MESGMKTRLKGSSRFVIGAGGADSLQPVFSNFRIFNDAVYEHDGVAYLIRKASLQVGDMVVPLLFKRFSFGGSTGGRNRPDAECGSAVGFWTSRLLTEYGRFRSPKH